MQKMHGWAIALAFALGTARGGTIVTPSRTTFNSFMGTATIYDFDSLAGFNNETPGTAIPSANQLTTQLSGLTFSSNGGPVGVLDLTGFGNITDTASQPNLITGTNTGAVICFTCFIDIVFSSPVSSVGAWNDPTGSNIDLTVFNGATVLDTVNADQGRFLGIVEGSSEITEARFVFNHTESVTGFTLDDLYVGGGATAGVPEPAAAWLLCSGLALLAFAKCRAT